MENTETVESPEDSPSGPTSCYPPVLDVCCGSRMMWFNRRDGRAVFVDQRCESYELSNGTTIEVKPDHVASFTDLPFPDATFALVVMDPPHIQRMSLAGDVTKKYGALFPNWRDTLRGGFAECFRVLRKDGVLIFKWCEVEIPLESVLALTPEKPLFGHRSGVKAATHWVTFVKT